MHMETFTFTFNVGSIVLFGTCVQRIASVPACYAAGQERGLVESFNTCALTHGPPFKR